MRHNPLSLDDIRATEDRKLKPGVYPFKVEDAQNKESKKGNEMIELSLRIVGWFNNDRVMIKDWLVSLDTMEWKLKSFFDCVNRDDIYQKKEIDPLLLIDLTGKVKLKQDGDYLRVESYVKAIKIEDVATEEEAPDDDIPF